MTIVSPASFEKSSSAKANGPFQQGDIDDRRGDCQRQLTVPYYYNALAVENRYISLLTLVNVTYPPHICPLCDQIFRSTPEADHHYRTAHRRRRFQCLHPHCDRRFSSRAALQFHMSRSHLVKQAPPQYTLQEPPFMQYKVEPSAGSFPSAAAAALAWRTPSQQQQQQHAPHTPLQLTAASEALVDAAYHPLVCPCCRQSFPHTAHVKQHVAETHRGQEPYRCVYSSCTTRDQCYPSRDSLVYHILRAHDSGRTSPSSSSPVPAKRALDRSSQSPKQ